MEGEQHRVLQEHMFAFVFVAYVTGGILLVLSYTRHVPLLCMFSLIQLFYCICFTLILQQKVPWIFKQNKFIGLGAGIFYCLLSVFFILYNTIKDDTHSLKCAFLCFAFSMSYLGEIKWNEPQQAAAVVVDKKKSELEILQEKAEASLKNLSERILNLENQVGRMNLDSDDDPWDVHEEEEENQQE
jgi:hypothetical protein